MFKLIFLAAAIFLVVTSKPQDNGRYKKRLAETQLNIVTYWSQGPYVLSPIMKCINALGYAVLVHMRLLEDEIRLLS